jgi:predicted Zn-dependent protease
VRSDTANAFVLPGNHVFMFTGLFQYTRNEDDLAAVLGHEVAHNLCRHSGETISSSLVVNLLARSSLMLDPSGLFVTILLPAATLSRELPQSRTQETEACN